jgi:hypothetical protein
MIQSTIQIQCGETAHLFWFDATVPLGGSVYLPDHLLQGLWTCVARAKLKPKVYGFQSLMNMPDGVVTLPADELLPVSD